MIPFQNVRMELMSSKQVAEYRKTNDMVIQPVGCFEMHGPRVPLGCDTFQMHAVGLMLAEEWGCLCLPPIQYSYPGASGPWPGTVNISPEVTHEYVKAVAVSLIENGFNRVVLYSAHGPNGPLLQNLARAVFYETDEVVVTCAAYLPDNDLFEELVGYPKNEELTCAAAMKLLGIQEAFDVTANATDAPIEFPSPAISGIREAKCHAPWLFTKDYQHTGLRTGMTSEDVDKCIDAYRQSVRRMAGLPEAFAEYQRQIRETFEAAPWASDDIWSE